MSVIRASHKSAVRNFEARATLANDKVDKISSKDPPEGRSRGEDKSSAVTGLLHLNIVSLADRLMMSIVYKVQCNTHKIWWKTPLHTMNGHSMFVPCLY